MEHETVASSSDVCEPPFQPFRVAPFGGRAFFIFGNGMVPVERVEQITWDDNAVQVAIMSAPECTMRYWDFKPLVPGSEKASRDADKASLLEGEQ